VRNDTDQQIGEAATHADRVLRQRLAAQLLAGPPARRPLDVVRRLLAVQGQDLRGAQLAVRARSTGLSVTDLDHALTVDRSLLITWLNRGTLHLVSAEDYPWLHALTVPPLFTGNARRLAQEGVSADAAELGVATIERALAREGPLTRDQLRDRLDAAGVRTAGQALVHILALASLRGIIVRGPMERAQEAFALVQDWLPTPDREPDRRQSLAELARRYLAGHGPADDRDLAKWAGLPLRDAREALISIGPELAERADGLLELRGRTPVDEGWPEPHLLGPYDPLLLGWRDRGPVVGERQGLVTVNGLFRPFALVDGRAVATWRLQRNRAQLEPFEPLGPAVVAALDAEARDVHRFLSRPPLESSQA
jgi:hypothetical protein